MSLQVKYTRTVPIGIGFYGRVKENYTINLNIFCYY